MACRKKTYSFFVILMLMFCSFSLFADGDPEHVDFKKKNFPGRKKEFRLAVSAFEKGNFLYERGKFREALDLFQTACDFNPDHTDLNFKLGICLLNTRNQEKAIEHFLKAEQLNASVSQNYPKFNYGLGLAYQYDYQ